MSFIYRFRLLWFLSCDARLLLWSRREGVRPEPLSRNSLQDHAVAGTPSGAVSAPCTLMRARKKINMGSFAAKSHGCFWWSNRSSLPTCLPSNQGFSSGISIKQVPPREQPSGMGRKGATSPRPSPHQPHGALLRQAAEPKGWSKLGWGGSSAPRPQSSKAMQRAECSGRDA